MTDHDDPSHVCGVRACSGYSPDWASTIRPSLHERTTIGATFNEDGVEIPVTRPETPKERGVRIHQELRKTGWEDPFVPEPRIVSIARGRKKKSDHKLVPSYDIDKLRGTTPAAMWVDELAKSSFYGRGDHRAEAERLAKLAIENPGWRIAVVTNSYQAGIDFTMRHVTEVLVLLYGSLDRASADHITLTNGTVIKMVGSSNPEQIRGIEFDHVHFAHGTDAVDLTEPFREELARATYRRAKAGGPFPHADHVHVTVPPTPRATKIMIDEDETETEASADPITLTEEECELVAELRHCRNERKELELEEKRLKAELMQILKGSEKAFDGGGHTVAKIRKHTRHGVNAKALEALYPDVFEEVQSETEVVTLELP